VNPLGENPGFDYFTYI